MNREVIPHTTRDAWLAARRFDVTSTEIAALFGCSPYLSAFELWHQKAGNITDEFEETERMRWGRRLQDVIAAGVCEDNGWQGRPLTDYMRLPDHRIGSSFDWLIETGEDTRLLEIKNVDVRAMKDGWLVVYETEESAGYVEAPPHIELQMQHEMLVSGYPTLTLAALVGGNAVRLLHREADSNVHEAIINAVSDFWRSIAAGEPPKPDYYRDAPVIKRLHPSIVGDVLALVEEDKITGLMRRHRVATAAAKSNDEDAKAIAAEIADLLGDRPGASGPAGTITRFPVAGGHVSYERKARIDMRINHAKK
jgi:putative phage-type endonuclease